MSGAAYVFELSDGGAARLARLTAGFVDERGWFGDTVALTADWLVIGAPLEDRGELSFKHADPHVDSTDDTGAAYVYERKGEALRDVKPIIGTVALGALGASLSISGNQLAVGAPTPVSGQGYAQLYTLGPTEASLVATLLPNDPDSYLFGFAIALRPDAVIVGAPFGGGRADGRGSGNIFDPYYQSSGSAYVFRAHDGGTWDSVPCRIKASNADPCDNFGAAVAATSSYFAVGSPLEDGVLGGLDRDGAGNDLLDTGAVYIYTTP